MFDLRKTAAALCLSGLATCGIVTSASAATTSASQASNFTQNASLAAFCKFRVIDAPRGLNVRKFDDLRSQIIGGLLNGARTSGDCMKSSKGMIHLSDQFAHLFRPFNARGWAFARFLRLQK